MLRNARALAAAILVISALPLLASRPYVVANDLAERLARGPVQGQPLILDRVPVIDGNPTTIELEPFEVWAPGATITVHDAKGVHESTPPPRLFYRGRIAGAADSTVFFSVDPAHNHDVEGLIFIADRKFTIGRGVRATSGVGGLAGRDDDATPMLIREVDALDDALDPRPGWQCYTDGAAISGSHLSLPKEALALREQTNAGNVAGATYALRLAIETDSALVARFGSAGNVQSYITSLVGATSVIYQRDLHTTLTIAHIGIWATPEVDPYAGAFSSTSALNFLGGTWHRLYCDDLYCTVEHVRRSAVVLVSGQTAILGGKAIPGHLPTPSAALDNYSGNGYEGPYAVVGPLEAAPSGVSVPDPNATVNGVAYGLPPDDKFSVLSIFAHELGHVVGSSHTQCTPLLPADQARYGRTFVDECDNKGGLGCFSGTTNSIGQACFDRGFTNGGSNYYCPAPPELGTIMSYCQYVYCPAGTDCGGSNGSAPYTYPQSRYIFGEPDKASSRMLTLFHGYLEAATPDGTIAIGNEPLACSAGQTASVPACNGCTYSWQLTGATLTSGTTGSSITFTPSVAAVTVQVTITTADGNAITTQATRSTSCSCYLRHRAVNFYRVPPADPEGSGFRLSVVLDPGETGITVAWFAQDSLPARQIGTGQQMHVTPLELTTYWAVLSRPCGSATVTDQTDNLVLSPSSGSGSHSTDLARVISVGGIPKTYAVLPSAGAASSLSIPADVSNTSTYEWRQGDQYDDSLPPLGTGTVLNVTGPGLFWVRTIASSGSATDSAVTRLVDHPGVGLDVFPGPGTVIGTQATVALTALYPNPPFGTTYQWRQATEAANGALFRDPNSAVLNTDTANWVFRPSGIVTHAAYWVRVITPGAVAQDSDPVLLSVGCDQAPFVTVLLNPSDTHVPTGRPITLFAVGFGRNLSYHWYRGPLGDLSNSMGSGGSSVSVTSPDGPYWVRATDDCGRSVDAGTILYSCKPTIPENGNPQDAYLPPGATVQLTVTATPAQPGQTLHYQWYAGNIVWPIAGATSSTLPVTQPGTFFAVVSSDCGDGAQGAVLSSPANVLACTPPVLGLTGSRDVRLGTSQTLQVSTTGDALSYQWYHGVSPSVSSPIPDATTSMLAVQANVDSDYWAQVADHGVCVTNSATVHLTVCYPPTISTQPAGASVFSGSTATLTVAATPTTPAPLHYAWLEVGADGSSSQIPGNDAPSFTTPALTTSRTWFVRVFSGNQLTVYADSQPATVHVCDLPEVHWASFPHPLRAGEPFTLQIMAPPAGSQLYWYRGTSGDVAHSTLLAGPIDTSYYMQVLPNSPTSTYWVRVTQDSCYADSSTFTLVVCVPTITQHPAGATINVGSAATLSVAATPANVTYQWYVGDSGDISHPVATATGSSYSPSPVADTRYWVRVTGSCGATADSGAAQVTVCFPPAIISNGPTQWAIVGSGTTLWVNATGNNLTYQWYVGASGNTSTAIPGATASTVNVTPQDTTTYWVRVSGSCGSSKDSGSMLVNVCGSPAITAQPQGSIVFSGATATMSVSASESTTTPMTYQWYRGVSGDVSAPVGSNATSFTTPALTTPTSYWVRVSCGICNPTDSQAATVSICNYPQTLGAPADQFIAIGQTASLTTYTGSGNVYQWYIGASGNTSQPAPGASNLASYTASPMVTTQYWAQIQNGGCISRTQSATVNVCVPTITQQPASLMINAGASTTLSVAANTPGLTYQWYIGNSGTTTSPVAGATGSGVTVSPGASTSYWVRVTGSCGRTADSATATVTICAPPAISYASPTQSIVRGSNAYCFVNATGSNLAYQWYVGTSGNTSTPVSGATASSLTTAPQNPTSYWVRVTGSCGTVNSVTMLVNVCTSPSITAQPQGSIIFSGGTATMSVAASEGTTTPMTYQWYRGLTGDVSAPVGSNSTTFTTPALTTSTSYWVRVSCGVCNPTDSQAATISICNYPQVLNSPGDFYDTKGQSVRLFAPNGSGNSYQWYYGASGDTSHPYPSPNYYYADVAPTATTQYWAQVQNGGCLSRTASANVYVCVPTFTQQPASVIIAGGSSTTLSASADTAGVTYQWYVGASGNTGAPIAGATGPSVTVTPGSNSSYWVRAIGTCGRTADSTTATVTLCAPPVITGQPGASTLWGGGTAYLWVYATGSNLTYQWYYGNSGDTSYPISGATTATPSLWIGATQKVWVRITGQCGAVNSNATFASVYPSIAQQPPANLPVGYDTTATISFTPSNGNYMSYVWRRSANGTVIATTSTPTLITPAITADTYIYCEVWSGNAVVYTNETLLSVCYNGPNVSITKAANGSCSIGYATTYGADDYEWYQGPRGDTSHLAGRGSPVLYVCPTTPTQYWLRAIVWSSYQVVSCYSDSNVITLP